YELFTTSWSLFFFFMTRPPPRSTLFPYTSSSDLRRTAGNSRRYSDRDIELLRRIQELTQEEGVNLAGARMILDLLSQVEELQGRSEEHTSELQSRRDLVCRLLLETKNI